MTPLIRNLCIHCSRVVCVPEILHQFEMTAELSALWADSSHL